MTREERELLIGGLEKIQRALTPTRNVTWLVSEVRRLDAEVERLRAGLSRIKSEGAGYDYNGYAAELLGETEGS